MRSACRGVARGAEPKRSKSARGPPVCMSSMAQHAVPKVRYQVEFLRHQLMQSSTVVRKNPLSVALMMAGPWSLERAPLRGLAPSEGRVQGVAQGPRGVNAWRLARAWGLRPESDRAILPTPYH